MKFIRFSYENEVKSGILNENNEIYELEYDTSKELLDIDLNNIDKSRSYNLEEVKIIEPVDPTKLVCVGLNYVEHGEELNMELPEEPKLFIKPSTATIGHEDRIIYPSMSKQVDYEGELGIVVGKKAKNIEINDAKDYIFGYTIVNDVTARDLQAKDEQWTRAKSFDTFAPIGPCVETDLNPLNLKLQTRLNGKIKQDSSTKNMIFNVYELLSFISKVMTLNSGDIIATGTPSGIGKMEVGDVVEISIENIGTLRNQLNRL